MIDILKLHPMTFFEYVELVTGEEIDGEFWIDYAPDYYEKYLQDYFKDMQRICYEPENRFDY